jgi:hypothetical protein
MAGQKHLQKPPQPFPKSGLLADNLDLTRSELVGKVGRLDGAVYSYVVKSVRMDETGEQFEHHGSAPNFQGGRLTLCTCKHQVRTNLETTEWQGIWIAGFTSRSLRVNGIPERHHWLFYLTKVRAAYDSHAELWRNLSAKTRERKSAKDNFLGDVFVPRGRVGRDRRFDPARYYTPLRGHSHRRNSCDTGWKNDIDYWCVDRYGRPSLLVGDSHLTFIWKEPIICLGVDHCRNFKTDTVRSLIRHLSQR